jgi:3-oxoacyl-[acyl-carrier-protein] synthase II
MSVPMAMVNMVAGAVSTDLRALGPSIVPATACASGTLAIGLARDLLLAGTCDIVVAGGAEAALTPFVVGGLSRLGGLSVRTDSPTTASRPFDRDRDGFVAAEGAGMVVLERPEDVVARGGRIRSRVIGFGSSCDAHHPTAPEPGSAGVERAIRASLADAGISGREVDHVNAHGTSTPLNDVAEACVIRKVYGDRPLVTSTKGVTGHALGAAGAIEAAFTVLAMEHKAVPPTANVTVLDPKIEVDVVTDAPRNRCLQVATSHSFGFGGHNAVLVLGAA